MTNSEQSAASPLQPSVSLLCKLGSIVRHVEEAHGPRGSTFDLGAAFTLADDEEVKAWLAAMDGMALLPVAR